jgi:hypothetical protein
MKPPFLSCRWSVVSLRKCNSSFVVCIWSLKKDRHNTLGPLWKTDSTFICSFLLRTDFLILYGACLCRDELDVHVCLVFFVFGGRLFVSLIALQKSCVAMVTSLPDRCSSFLSIFVHFSYNLSHDRHFPWTSVEYNENSMKTRHKESTRVRKWTSGVVERVRSDILSPLYCVRGPDVFKGE